MIETPLKEQKQEEKPNQMDMIWLDKFLEGNTIQEKSRDFCGKIFVKTTIEGAATTHYHQCGQYRTCDFCYQARKMNFRSRLLLGAEAVTDLVAIVTSAEAVHKMVKSRKTTADDYIRNPLNDDEVIVAISKGLADSIDGFEYDKCFVITTADGEIDDKILTLFSNLPEGKRSSGDLGKCEKLEKEEEVIPQPEDENDVFIFEYPYYVINTTSHDATRLFAEAIVESSTKGIPETASEITELLNNRFDCFESKLFGNRIDFMIIRRKEKTVSLKHMLANVIVRQEIVNVDITVNKRITTDKQPISEALARAIEQETSEYQVLYYPI